MYLDVRNVFHMWTHFSTVYAEILVYDTEMSHCRQRHLVVRNTNSITWLVLYSVQIYLQDTVDGFLYKMYAFLQLQSCPLIHWFVINGFSHPQFTAARKKKRKRNKRFVSFKTRAKLERALTWWNPAAQNRSVIDSSSFAPVLTVPCRTCFYFASSVLAVRVSRHVIAVFVFREPLFINKLYRICVCYTNITLYITFGIIRGFT
jgi:hypothetical protein